MTAPSRARLASELRLGSVETDDRVAGEFTRRADFVTVPRPALPAWLTAVLWLVAAGVLGLAAGIDAEVTALSVLTAALLVLLLGHLEVAVLVVVVGAGFVSYARELVPADASTQSTVLLAVLLGAWAIRYVHDAPSSTRRDPLARPVMALALCLVLSSVVNVGGSGTMQSLARWLALLVLALVLGDSLRRRLRIETVVRFYVGACAAAALCGIVQAALVDADHRVRGPLTDPNDLAFVLLAALPLSIGVRRSGTRSWPWDACSVIIAVGLVGTLSRGAALGLLTMLVFATLTRQLSRQAAVGTLGVLLTGVGLATSLFRQQIHGVLDVDADTAGRAVAERDYLWRTASDMTLSNPLLGKGPGSFGLDQVPVDDRLPLALGRLLDVGHDTYLEVAAQVGLVGLAAVVVVLVVGFVGSWRCWRRERSPMAAGLCCALLGVAVAGLFLNGTLLLPFWLLSALGAAIGVGSDETARGPHELGPYRVESSA